MGNELLSVEQVADRLGLHVRTVRGYVRDGKLKAVRIGKQYRITHTDLAAFTGLPAAVSASRRLVEVSSIVQIDGVDRATADRLSIVLTAGLQAPRDTPEPLRLETIHDESRSRMKIVILGGPAATADLLAMIDSLTSPDSGLFAEDPG
jgi:excisionase family DNA binding protein